MANKRKTARQKLEIDREPEVKGTPKGLMLIPKPLDVDALMRRIEPGKLATVDQIRDCLAQRHNADYTCPLTTGIFMRIAAEAAEEDLLAGKGPITPYWRVIKKDGSLNPKFPGGAEAQAARLTSEGHTIEAGKGKKPPKVKDFDKALQVL
jgi:hypothetical protein